MAFKDQSTIPKATFIEIGVCIQGAAAPSRILQHLVLISKSSFLLEKQSITQVSFYRFKKMTIQPLFQLQRNAEKAYILIRFKGKSDLSVFTHVVCTYANLFRTKESVYIRKEFDSHGTGLGHQHGRRFIVLEHQYGGRDVT